MELNLIRVQAIAARVACEQMTKAAVRAVRDSVDRASCLPARPGWERKATAHAEIFGLLADVAGDRTARLSDSPAAAMRELILTVGSAADGMIASSRRTLLAHLGLTVPDGVCSLWPTPPSPEAGSP
jgi:hypothetical protein